MRCSRLGRPSAISGAVFLVLALVVVACGGGDGDDGGGDSGGDGTPVSRLELLTVTRCNRLDGECALFFIDPEGEVVPTRISDWRSSATFFWSPDGTHLATIEADGIFVMGMDDREFELVTADVSVPVWSPDGSQFAFTTQPSADEPLTAPDVYISNADGTEIELLEEDAWAPAWSPDGTQLAFISDEEIYVSDADGGGKQQLTSDGTLKGTHRWSPDGKSIGYEVAGGPRTLAELWVAEVGTGNAVQIAESETFRSWFWSLDGERILFVQRPADSSQFETDVFSATADGSEVVNLTNDPAEYSDLLWSSDGLQIAFASDRDGAERAVGGFGNNVYLMNADGSDVRQITQDDEFRTGTLVWSPSETAVAFQGLRGGVFVAQADGSETTRVTFTSQETIEQSLVWSNVASDFGRTGQQSDLEAYIWGLESISGRAAERLLSEAQPKSQELSTFPFSFDYEAYDSPDEATEAAVAEGIVIATDTFQILADLIREMRDGLEALEPPVEAETANAQMIEGADALVLLVEDAILQMDQVESLEDIEELADLDAAAVEDVGGVFLVACNEIQSLADEDGIPVALC